MKISEKWLREWVNPSLTTDELVAQITMAGLEVDGVEPVADQFSGVVVGEIAEIAPHPDADKLRVCQVNAGNELVQVVCGAANAAAGLKVPFATVGAILPGDFKIKKAKLRGVESFGMLCAAQELGLEEQSDGLLELPADAPVGMDIRQYLALDDQVIEVDLTPNRADCLSVRGLAREVGLLNKLPVAEPSLTPVQPSLADVVPVEVLAAKDCPRYIARIIRGVDVTVSTPRWILDRLARGGIRSIDIIVDVTNYVLLEMGQPLHAFDLDKIDGGIKVRHAAAGEKLQLLDGQEVELKSGSLVIADQGKALALAGIMGGQDSAVGVDTVDILLESAFFSPIELAGRARSYGLHTESSHRFERGVDYQLQKDAAERATQLITDISGGQAGPLLEVLAEGCLPKAEAVNLRVARISQLLGFEMSAGEVVDILTRLGMQVTAVEGGWQVIPPAWRFDIAIEADLLEELARVYGYNRLPVSHITADLELKPQSETQAPLAKLRDQLIAAGYQEAITYSFVSPSLQELLDPGAPTVALANPISADLAVMRTSLFGGLLNTTTYNLNRQQNRIRLFESGLTFKPSGHSLPVQQPMLAALICGRRYPESWSETGEMADFYDLKGDLEAVLSAAGCENVGFVRGVHPALHPGQTATILLRGEQVGVIGALHPQIQKKLGFSQPVFMFEVNLSAITKGELPKFTELSKYPEVRRDLAILIDREFTAEEVLSAAKTAAGDALKNLRLFDIYEGKGIDPKRKSLALGLTFQHSSRTLNDEEVNAAVAAVVSSLEANFGATLRN